MINRVLGFFVTIFALLILSFLVADLPRWCFAVSNNLRKLRKILTAVGQRSRPGAHRRPSKHRIRLFIATCHVVTMESAS
jgi:hypothetical protein